MILHIRFWQYGWECEDKDNDGELDLDASNNTLETDPINCDSDGERWCGPTRISMTAVWMGVDKD